MTDAPPTMIEDYIPVEEISYESSREKVARRRNGHLSTLHLWWARRPLAASRAAVYATFAPPATGEARADLARFFTNLGFVVPEELKEIAGEFFYADLSAEHIDLFNQDVLVFLGLQFAQGGSEAIAADPLISQLQVAQDGRIVFVPTEYDDALQFGTVLSLEYALEGIDRKSVV